MEELSWYAKLEAFLPYIKAVIIFIIGLIIVKIVKKVEPKFLKKTNIEPLAHKFATQIISGVIWIVIFVSMAATVGINISSIIAIFAAAGAAVALAVQDSLSNLFGGFIVMASDILNKGDLISVGGIEGTVESIDLLHTTILTSDKRVVTIPNATMNKSNIINFSRSDLRRIEIVFGVPYSEDTEAARYALTRMAAEDNRILDDPQPSCHITEYAAGKIMLSLKAWVKNENYWDVNFYLKNNIKNVLEESGIVMSPIQKKK